MRVEHVGARGALTTSSMRDVAGRARATLAAASLLAVASPLGALELSGRVEIEPRAFLHSPEHPRQKHHGLSFAVQPELYHAFDDDRQSLLFTPFLRLDTADDRRSHFDVRELMYQRVFDDFELRAGIGHVFWGVAESYHLVDVIKGLLVEHLFDGRGGRAPHPLENDLFAGVRLGVNDEAGTELVTAIIADAEGDATALSLEASRRIGDDWKVELEGRAWNGVEDDDPMAPLRRDDYLQLTLSHFF